MTSKGKSQPAWYLRPWGISLICFLVAAAIMAALIYQFLVAQSQPNSCQIGAASAISNDADCSNPAGPQLNIGYSILADPFSFQWPEDIIIPFDILLPALFISFIVYSRSRREKIRNFIVRPLLVLNLVGLYMYLIYDIFHIYEYGPLFTDPSSSIALSAWDTSSALNYLPVDLFVAAVLLVVVPLLARKYRVL